MVSAALLRSDARIARARQRVPVNNDEHEHRQPATAGATFEHDDDGRNAGSAIAVMRETDDYLMARVAAGDHAAYRALVDRHLAAIFAFAARTLGDRAAGEDIAQEVFARVWTHAHRWQPGSARLTTWLHRIAYNLCLDHIGKRHEQTNETAVDMVDASADVTAQLAVRDIQMHVNAALADLPEPQRAALTLCHYQGLRNREAAEILGISVEALESLLARGRRTLRSRLRTIAPALLRE